MPDSLFDDDDLISSYTRAQAIADGQLIDVSEMAREAGIRYPVALTATVWARCVEVPAGVVTALIGAPIFVYLARRQKVTS